jgi:hypothetical protein
MLGDLAKRRGFSCGIFGNRFDASDWSWALSAADQSRL